MKEQTPADHRMLVRLLGEGEKIDEHALLAFVSHSECGALVSFAGVVRDTEEGRPLLALVYEHHPLMALGELQGVVREALGRFDVRRIACAHRTGRVEVGEASVFIAVAARHRAGAFEACQFVIDDLKRRVPLWKSAVFAGERLV